jgi:hypothetical protein
MGKTRALRGTGSVFEDVKRGRWRGKISIDGTVHTVYGKDKTEARAKLNTLLKSGGGSQAEASKLTVARLVDEWLERDLAGRDLAPSTVARHKWATDKIKRMIGKKWKPGEAIDAARAEGVLAPLKLFALGRAGGEASGLLYSLEVPWKKDKTGAVQIPFRLSGKESAPLKKLLETGLGPPPAGITGG